MKREFIFSDVIARAKESFGCPSDKALALKLGMSPQTFANRKNTESLPYPEIFSVALECGADMGYILTGNRAGAVQSQGQTTNPPVDIALLESVIDSLETALLRHGRKLDPSRKARAIAVLYECCADKGSEAQAHINSLLEDMV